MYIIMRYYNIVGKYLELFRNEPKLRNKAVGLIQYTRRWSNSMMGCPSCNLVHGSIVLDWTDN